MITVSKGDAWMGLKFLQGENTPIRITWRKRVRLGWRDGMWEGRWYVPLSQGHQTSLWFVQKGINNNILFYLSRQDWTKTGVSEPQLADHLFKIVYRGGGSGVTVRSLFECSECPESSKLISDEMASMGNPPELGREILLLILSELTEMLCWCTCYGDDSVG